jgi:hypothetical protein
VRELVERFAGFYLRPRPVGETLDLVGLGDRGDARAGTLGRVRWSVYGVLMNPNPE